MTPQFEVLHVEGKGLKNLGWQDEKNPALVRR